MGEGSTHVKRHGLAAAGVFVLVLTVATFVVFFAGVWFGFVAVMACCSGSSRDGDGYLLVGLLLSLAAAIGASILTFRWLRARHHRRAAELG